MNYRVVVSKSNVSSAYVDYIADYNRGGDIFSYQCIDITDANSYLIKSLEGVFHALSRVVARVCAVHNVIVGSIFG